MVLREKIDFVIPWVDGGDADWRKLRNFYAGDSGNKNEAQYRDWGILKYWFRCVEQYAPWVNKIHFVTCGQIPDWLNTEHPKLHCVHHKDYIPEEYLPTFSSHVIELNFHRIPGLAEQFVYFNDDMYINAPVKPTDFFENGYPCESAVLAALIPPSIKDPFVHYLCNNMTVINSHFRKKDVIRASGRKWFTLKYGKYILKNLYFYPLKSFLSFHNFHVAASLRKSTFEAVWQLEPEVLHNTCKSRFRKLSDVNQYVMSWYDICKGEFNPRRTDTGQYYTIGQKNEALCEDLRKGKHKLLCINDDPKGIDNIENVRKELIEVFEKKLPNKSAFEK